MLLSIIPLDSSIDDEGLTYFAKDTHKKDIHTGSLVSIPLRERICYGIVADILKTPATDEENLKSIVNIACSTPLLAPYQFDVIRALATKHFVHIHKVLALFLPKFVFNTLEKKAFEPMIDLRPLTLKKVSRPISFFHNTKSLPLTDYIRAFLAEKSGQSAIIFPDDLLLSSAIKHLPAENKEATIIKNSDTYTKRYKWWLQTSKHTNRILIWTRRLLQYNLAGYEHILYIEDALAKSTHSYEHIYPNHEFLDILAHSWFDITIFSNIPTMESMLAIRQWAYILRT